MASEIRVDKINSRSGVGTVTLSPTGVDISGITTVSTLKVGTGVTASSDGDIFFTGIATATTFVGNLTGDPTGSGANLTALPAGQLTGTVADARISTLTASKLSGALPAISALNLTNVPAANVVGVHTSLNITGSTTVGGGVTISESGIEASGIGITVANINGAHVGGRNLVINGDMRIAQRAASSTSTGYQTVDRFSIDSSGLNENMTQAHVNVSSGTTPYTLGFRKALKITNGNQTGGAGNADYANIQYKFEAQDVSNSGWNYISSSSYITISFWVKSSVAQTFYAYLRTKDGTNYHYPISFALSANTWTKVTKTISGNSNLQIDDDNGEGMQFTFMLFYGTNYTDSGATLNAWQATASGNSYSPDNTTTWYTTNDATFEITGVQLEVGSQATPFEHRRLDDELFACQRYYCELFKRQSDESQYSFIGLQAYTTTNIYGTVGFFPRKMRALPTITVIGTLKFSNKSGGNIFEQNSGTMGNAVTRETVGTHGIGFDTAHFIQGGFANGFTDTDGSDYIKADAEL